MQWCCVKVVTERLLKEQIAAVVVSGRGEKNDAMWHVQQIHCGTDFMLYYSTCIVMCAEASNIHISINLTTIYVPSYSYNEYSGYQAHTDVRTMRVW